MLYRTRYAHLGSKDPILQNRSPPPLHPPPSLPTPLDTP